ncbi:hypothetical protein, conserved [Eimeria brunetti]|uniref:Fungal lipase-type domain-containing protein n=1 Tax=Eimeria brunetti TaxID=51314 RepID=U6LU39_9EIME|nr:hypothetical protein, conserved [Eimeria brunetti]
MVGTLRLLWLLLIIHVSGVLGAGLFEEELKSYPVVGVLAADARRPDTPPSDSEEAPRGALHNEERVHLKPDGTVSFDCPRSVCGTEFYFGRVLKGEENHEPPKKLTDKDGAPRASSMSGADESVGTNSAEGKSENPTEELLLKDIVHITDMSWLGTDEKMHQLAFVKNSTVPDSPQRLCLVCACATVKVCETVQTYPERLLQGFPGHVHPDHPSYVQLPIYKYFRKAGAEVAFPKDAPTIFQPRIYDGNIPVDRKLSSSKLGIFSLAAELLFGAKGEAQRGETEPSSADPAPSVDAGMQQKSNVSEQHTDLENAELHTEKPQLSEESSGSDSARTAGATTPEWKREMYRAWHSLWILNLVAYEASDIWGWVQNHRASTFIFPPWKVTDVGVLRTAEAAPMRWRDLSPRFHVEPNMELSLEALKQGATPGNDGVHTESGEGVGKGEAGGAPPLQLKLGQDVGRSVSSGTQEDDAMVAGRHAKEYSGVTSSKSAEAAAEATERRSDPWGDVASTVVSTAKFKEEPDAKKAQETPGADVLSREGAREKQGADIFAGSLNSTGGNSSSSSDVPEGCIPYLTDMSLFKKFGWPSGRLVFAGPSGSKKPDEAGNTTGEWVDGSWKPKIIGSNVKCLPVVHPDTCGLTASFNRLHEAPWVWRFERDRNVMPSSREDNLAYADIVWIFRGTFVSKQWLLNGMGVAVPYKTLSKRGHFHYGLTYLFDKAVRPLMEKHLKLLEHQIVGRKTPLVVVFSGHSLGAAIAEMSSWYFAKRAKTLVDKNMLEIRTVAFGSPSWGDKMAYEDFLASGVKSQEINMDIDPVGVLFGEEDLTKLSHKKPFLMKLYVEDMDKVEVASSTPGAPPFSGRIWTRPTYRPTPILRRLAAMFFDLENVDMVLLDPTLAHFVAYTASLTIMAGLLEEASFGSGVAAPLADAVFHLVGHPRNAALKKAYEQLDSVLRRVDADRAAEEGSKG